MMQLPISVLIPCKNEEHNIADCIRSVLFSDDIVIVDSSSTDRTLELAAELGAKVVNFEWNGTYPKKKNWALENIPWKHEWVLIIDADERISAPLADEFARLNFEGDIDGYFINRRFWFLDGWLRHCGYYPSWNLRLFRHAKGRYEQFNATCDTQSGDNEVHEHVVLNGKLAYLQNDMDHYAFPTISVWIEKHNRYSNWEARLALSRGRSELLSNESLGFGIRIKRLLKYLSYRLPFRPTQRFLYHYVLRLGLLDGYRGYVFCRLLGFYEFLSVSKARELTLTAARMDKAKP